jgi:hypothetical protein
MLISVKQMLAKRQYDFFKREMVDGNKIDTISYIDYGGVGLAIERWMDRCVIPLDKGLVLSNTQYATRRINILVKLLSLEIKFSKKTG